MHGNLKFKPVFCWVHLLLTKLPKKEEKKINYFTTSQSFNQNEFYFPYNLFSSHWNSWFGFTDGGKPVHRVEVSGPPNSYGIQNSYGIEGHGSKIDTLWLSGKEHKLECPTKVIAVGEVVGSGLMLNSRNEWVVFFTRNGILLGKLLL
jgi:hypothetical protein